MPQSVMNRRERRRATRSSGLGRLPGRPKAGTSLPWPPAPRPRRVLTAVEQAERAARRARPTRRQRLADLRAEIPGAAKADLKLMDADLKRHRARVATQDEQVAA